MQPWADAIGNTIIQFMSKFDNGINVQRREREQLELQQDELKKNVRHKLLVIVLDE